MLILLCWFRASDPSTVLGDFERVFYGKRNKRLSCFFAHYVLLPWVIFLEGVNLYPVSIPQLRCRMGTNWSNKLYQFWGCLKAPPQEPEQLVVFNSRPLKEIDALSR